MRDSKFDAQLKPGYAWTKPYCLRYRTLHPTMLILGDSIFDGWSGFLLREFPDALIDARVGRQFSQGVRDYAALLQYSGIRSIRQVVIELGTNGPVKASQVQELMQLAGPNREVFWITPSVPRPWQQEVLAVSHAANREYPNLTLIHWHRLAKGKRSWFWPDMVHPNWTGIQHLVSIIR